MISSAQKQLKEVRNQIARTEFDINRELNPWFKLRFRKKLLQLELKKARLKYKVDEEKIKEDMKRSK
jgi:hypothetical protein